MSLKRSCPEEMFVGNSKKPRRTPREEPALPSRAIISVRAGRALRRNGSEFVIYGDVPEELPGGPCGRFRLYLDPLPKGPYSLVGLTQRINRMNGRHFSAVKMRHWCWKISTAPSQEIIGFIENVKRSPDAYSRLAVYAAASMMKLCTIAWQSGPSVEPPDCSSSGEKTALQTVDESRYRKLIITVLNHELDAHRTLGWEWRQPDPWMVNVTETLQEAWRELHGSLWSDDPRYVLMQIAQNELLLTGDKKAKFGMDANPLLEEPLTGFRQWISPDSTAVNTVMAELARQCLERWREYRRGFISISTDIRVLRMIPVNRMCATR